MRPWTLELWMPLWLFYFLPGVTFGEDTVLEIINRPTRKWRAWKIWEGDGFFQKESYLPGVSFEVQGCGLRWWNWGVSSFNLIRWPCIEFLRAKILWSQNPWLQKIKNGQVSHSVIFSFGEYSILNPPRNINIWWIYVSFHRFTLFFSVLAPCFPHPGFESPKDSDPPFADVLETSLNSLPLLRARSLKGGKGGLKGTGKSRRWGGLHEESAFSFGGSGERGGRHLWCFWQKKVTLLKGPMICRHSSEIQLNDIVDPWQMKQ